MKKIKSLTLLCAAFFFSQPAFSCDEDFGGIIHESLVTEGRGVNEQSFFGGGINQQEFNSVIEAHENVFGPIVRQIGASLTVNRLWTDNRENANAQKTGSRWVINMFGGLARNSLITRDAMMVVLCHEQGHLTAGFPAYTRFGGTTRLTMLGSEGNSDYFATHACADKVMNNLAIAEEDPWNEELDGDAAAEFCRKVGGSNCLAKARGGLALAQWLAVANRQGEQVSIETPDTSTVSRSVVNSYPRTSQCRLDTLLAGAACKTAYNHVNYPINERQMRAQSCNNYTGSAESDREAGVRPRCWFAPSGSRRF